MDVLETSHGRRGIAMRHQAQSSRNLESVMRFTDLDIRNAADAKRRVRRCSKMTFERRELRGLRAGNYASCPIPRQRLEQ